MRLVALAHLPLAAFFGLPQLRQVMNRLRRKAHAASGKSITITRSRSGGKPSTNTAADTKISTDQARPARATLCRTTLTLQSSTPKATEQATAASASRHV